MLTNAAAGALIPSGAGPLLAAASGSTDVIWLQSTHL
jgi:hypothetical protein